MMSAEVRQLIEEVAAIGAGGRATEPIPDDLTDTLATMAGRVAGSLPDERLACPWLLSALTAAYHLGRRHTMEQMAIGIDMGTADAWRESVGKAKLNRAGLDALEN